MKGGRIAQAGKYDEILGSGEEFMELVGAHKDALTTLDAIDVTNGGNEASSSSKTASLARSVSVEKKDKQNGKEDDANAQSGQLVQEEEREKGRVGFWVYWKYLTLAYRGALVPFILLAQILFQVLQIASNYWMAWAAPVSKDVEPPVSMSTLIYVYVALAFGSSLCILVRALILVTAAYKTATLLFNKMHMSIFRAPMSFFDSTPSGRILNRVSHVHLHKFSRKLGLFSALVLTGLNCLGFNGSKRSGHQHCLPDGICCIFHHTTCWNYCCDVSGCMAGFCCFYSCACCLLLVSGTFALFFLPFQLQDQHSSILTTFMVLQRYYIDTARELQRLVGVCKAPIIQHFAESITGSTTIRSFGKENQFVSTNSHLMDAFSRPKFYNAAAMEWLCFRLDMLSSLTFAFSLIFLVNLPTGLIDPGMVTLYVLKMIPTLLI